MAQQSFSTSQEPAVWRTIPVLKFLQRMWGTMANTLKFHELKDAINGGLKNLDKWYRKTKDTNAYFICLGKCLDDLISTSLMCFLQPSIPAGSSHTPT